MSKRGRRKPVDPGHFQKYQRVGAAFRKSAEDLVTLAEAGDSYGNAIGIAAIHACIAYSDALCVRYGGFKSSEGEHVRAIDALREALGHRSDEPALKLLRRILAQKDRISYQGDYYTVGDSREVVSEMSAFCECAESLLG
jgi:hypothetical protein